MKRLALFVALLTVFLLLTFPHQILIRRLVSKPLAASGIEVSMAKAGFALPLGYRVRALRAAKGPYGVTLGSVYMSLSRRVSAKACGGSVEGRIGSFSAPQLELELDGIDPSLCLELGGLDLAGDFAGTVEISGRPGTEGGSGSLNITANEVSVSGKLPEAAGEAVPAGLDIGQWRLSDVALEAAFTGYRVEISSARALIEGLEYELAATLAEPTRARAAPLGGQLRVRAATPTNRGKVLLGMLPKARERAGGWRAYRVGGTVAKPFISAMD